jgi:hypothetical protein
MTNVKNLLTHTNLVSSVTWAKQFGRSISPWAAPIEWHPPIEEDSRKALCVEDLDPEWIQALETADYSHLPKMKKQPA